MNDKIINLKKKKKKYDIVFSASVFDLFHHAHKELLEMMRAEGEKVIIFLHDDLSTYKNKGKFPVQSFEHRADNLYKTGLVDYVFKVENQDPSNNFISFIENVKPKTMLFMRGDDKWNGGEAPGLETIRDYHIPIKYKKYTKGISSSKIRDSLNK